MTSRRVVHRVYLFVWAGWLLILLCCGLFIAGDPWRLYDEPYLLPASTLSGGEALQVTLYLCSYVCVGIAFARLKGTFNGRAVKIRNPFSTWVVDRDKIVGFTNFSMGKIKLDSGQSISAPILGEVRFLEKMRESDEPLDLKALGDSKDETTHGSRVRRSYRGLWVYALPWLFGILVSLLASSR